MYAGQDMLSMYYFIYYNNYSTVSTSVVATIAGAVIGVLAMLAVGWGDCECGAVLLHDEEEKELTVQPN